MRGDRLHLGLLLRLVPEFLLERHNQIAQYLVYLSHVLANLAEDEPRLEAEVEFVLEREVGVVRFQKYWLDLISRCSF